MVYWKESKRTWEEGFAWSSRDCIGMGWVSSVEAICCLVPSAHLLAITMYRDGVIACLFVS